MERDGELWKGVKNGFVNRRSGVRIPHPAPVIKFVRPAPTSRSSNGRRGAPTDICAANCVRRAETANAASRRMARRFAAPISPRLALGCGATRPQRAPAQINHGRRSKMSRSPRAFARVIGNNGHFVQ